MNSGKSYLLILFFSISVAGYLLIGYGIERRFFNVFITAYGILFICYFLSIKWSDSLRKIKWAIAAAFIFRISLLFSFPTLSDDFYRFIWDGRLLSHGMNPFAHTPQFYIQSGLPAFLSADLFNHLSVLSQAHYTVYPAVAQYIFTLSTAVSGSSLFANIVVMKAIMIAFEAGSFWVMKKLLYYFNLPLKYLLIYALNPLIILELTGNLHFEGVMIFFLLAAFYFFLKQRIWLASFCFLIAVNTKLIPLILLPYLVFSIGWKRSAQLIGVLVAGTIVLHIPFLGPHLFSHFGDSLLLYFQSFEFNASIYYLVRWAGFQLVGYNIIHTAAPVLAGIATVIILIISWMKRDSELRNLPAIFICIFTVYFLFSTTVHPWYITTLIAFVPFTGFYFPLVWSAVIPFTYITYMTSAYNENLWLVAVEYTIVFAVMGYDWYHRRLESPLSGGDDLFRLFSEQIRDRL